MPGETHLIGCDIDADTIMALLQVLLDLPEENEPGGTPSPISASTTMARWTCGNRCVRSSANAGWARRSTLTCSIRR